MKQPEATPFPSPEPSTSPERLSPVPGECPPFDLQQKSDIPQLPAHCIPPMDTKGGGSISSIEAKVNLTCDEPMDIPLQRSLFGIEDEKDGTPEKVERTPPVLREGNAEITQPRRGSTCSMPPSHGFSPHLRPATPYFCL